MGNIAALNRGKGRADTDRNAVGRFVRHLMADFLAELTWLVFAFALGWHSLLRYGFIIARRTSVPAAIYRELLPAIEHRGGRLARSCRMLGRHVSPWRARAGRIRSWSRISFGFRALASFRITSPQRRSSPTSPSSGLHDSIFLGGVVVIERMLRIQGLGSLMVDRGPSPAGNYPNRCSLHHPSFLAMSAGERVFAVGTSYAWPSGTPGGRDVKLSGGRPASSTASLCALLPGHKPRGLRRGAETPSS